MPKREHYFVRCIDNWQLPTILTVLANKFTNLSVICLFSKKIETKSVKNRSKKGQKCSDLPQFRFMYFFLLCCGLCVARSFCRWVQHRCFRKNNFISSAKSQVRTRPNNWLFIALFFLVGRSLDFTQQSTSIIEGSGLIYVSKGQKTIPHYGCATQSVHVSLFGVVVVSKTSNFRTLVGLWVHIFFLPKGKKKKKEEEKKRHSLCWWLRSRMTRWGWRARWFWTHWRRARWFWTPWRRRMRGRRSGSRAAPSWAARTGSHGVAARGRSTASSGCCTAPEERTSCNGRQKFNL